MDSLGNGMRVVSQYLGDDLERDLRLGVPVLVRVQLQRCVRPSKTTEQNELLAKRMRHPFASTARRDLRAHRAAGTASARRPPTPPRRSACVRDAT